MGSSLRGFGEGRWGLRNRPVEMNRAEDLEGSLGLVERVGKERA
jgi:hypothetical protein